MFNLVDSGNEQFGYLGKLNVEAFENKYIKKKLISTLTEKSLSSSNPPQF